MGNAGTTPLCQSDKEKPRRNTDTRKLRVRGAGPLSPNSRLRREDEPDPRVSEAGRQLHGRPARTDWGAAALIWEVYTARLEKGTCRLGWSVPESEMG